jgi:tripartite-type tricarboxylate transporter receptor subunit TctC
MRSKFKFLAASGLLLLSSAVLAQWPQRPLQLIVPFPAGGTIDVVGRAFAQALAGELQQSVVVINKEGGSGTIGTASLAGSAPNGYTVGFLPDGPLTVQPSLNPRLPYSMEKLKPVCRVFSYPYVLAVRQDSPYGSLGAFVDAAKSARKELSYAFGGVGTAPHFAMLQLAQLGKVKFLGVPYRGDPPAAVGLKGGEVDAAVLTVEVARQLDFKILAVFANQRPASLPQSRTAREQAFDVVASTSVGVVAPAGVGAPVVQRLEAACSTVTRSAQFQDSLRQFNQSAEFLPGERFESMLRADAEVKRRLIDASGIRTD